MVKKLFFASLIFTSILNSQEPNLLGSLLYIEVEADVETEPVFAGDDAADDMCCLLYTSPSPRDCDRSRMPSSA